MSASVEAQLDALADTCMAAIRNRVLNHLAVDRQPLGARAIAQALRLDHDAVQRAICALVIAGKLARAGRGPDGKPAYRPVEIGTCEWCGLIDHHLVAGECPRCKNLTEGKSRE